jgi:hypothetical protein
MDTTAEMDESEDPGVPEFEQLELFDIWTSRRIEINAGEDRKVFRVVTGVDWLPWFELLDMDDPYLLANGG